MKTIYELAKENPKKYGKKLKQFLANKNKKQEKPMTTQDYTSDLLLAASRARSVSCAPATREQCAHIARLLVKRGFKIEETDYSYTNSRAILTHKGATVEINTLLNWNV